MSAGEVAALSALFLQEGEDGCGVSRVFLTNLALRRADSINARPAPSHEIAERFTAHEMIDTGLLLVRKHTPRQHDYVFWSVISPRRSRR